MFVKLFSSILDSSLWFQDAFTRILFFTMIAMADREGRIFTSKIGLMKRANIPEKEFDRALAVLEGPDPNSSDLARNPENDGRRVEPAEGGWLVLNYKYYRGLKDAEQRRFQDTIRKRQSRQSRKVTTASGQPGKSRRVTTSHNDDGTNRKIHEIRQAEAEAEADTEAEAEARKGGAAAALLGAPSVGSPGPEGPKRTPEEQRAIRIAMLPFAQWTDEDVAAYLEVFPEHRERLDQEMRKPPRQGGRGRGIDEVQS